MTGFSGSAVLWADEAAAIVDLGTHASDLEKLTRRF